MAYSRTLVLVEKLRCLAVSADSARLRAQVDQTAFIDAAAVSCLGTIGSLLAWRCSTAPPALELPMRVQDALALVDPGLDVEGDAGAHACGRIASA
eukprot:5842341-Alexandrium_andersonii.AAC.1